MGSIIGFKNTSVANASFLFATTPLHAAILGRLVLGEPVAAPWRGLDLSAHRVTGYRMSAPSATRSTSVAIS